ncbi:MAG TPA: hypothetical protein VG937_15730 [Polyangiaceae bacterium]|nr:hypothetical protein [Polyangiaceae bacterium]
MAALVTLASSAHAAARWENGRGLDLRLFRPPADPDGYLTVNGTRTLRPWELGLRLTLDAGFGLVPVRAFDWDSAQTPEQATRTQTVVDSVATGVIGISLGLASHLVVGAALPLQRVAGKAVVIPALYNDRADREPGELSSFGLGELEISAKYSLLEVVPGGFITPGGRAGVSGVLRFGVPTGDTEQFRGEPGITLWPSVVTEYAPFPFLRGALEAGYRFVARDGAEVPSGGRSSPVQSDVEAAPNLRYRAGCSGLTTTATCSGPVLGGDTVTYDDLATLGAGLNVAATPRLGVLAEWYAAAVVSALGRQGAISGEVALGLRYQLTSYVSVTLGGSLGAPRGIEAATGRGFLSLLMAPTDADLDGDGYATRDDACPDSAEDFDGFEDSDGCPEPDNDGDRVPDASDPCPDDAGPTAGAGCPLQPLGDRDRDGVNDYRDDCPDVAAPGTADGCPTSAGAGTPGGTR